MPVSGVEEEHMSGTNPAIDIRVGVAYGRGSGRELCCDFYRPAVVRATAPAVLLLHGGGWSRGDRTAMKDFGERLATEGFVCIAPEYRLTGEAPWPAQIEDVKTTIRWCRSQAAALAIDEARIVAMGFSAGAHLALLAAGTPGLAEFSGTGGNGAAAESVAAVVAVYPPISFYTGPNRTSGASPAASLLGDAATPAAANAAGPLSYVTPGFPPVFLIHGTADKVVPPSASRVMYEALTAAGVAVEMHLYAEQPHGFARQPEFVDLVSAESAHFFRRRLGIPYARAALVASG